MFRVVVAGDVDVDDGRMAAAVGVEGGAEDRKRTFQPQRRYSGRVRRLYPSEPTWRWRPVFVACDSPRTCAIQTFDRRIGQRVDGTAMPRAESESPTVLRCPQAGACVLNVLVL